MNVKMDSRAGFQREGILSASVPNAKATPLPAGRAALTPGHKRQIFFGLEDLTDSSSLTRGYEEIDAEGTPVPRTQRPVARFGPALNTICLPLGRGQIPVRENWELEQSSTENHNFDVHQSRLWVQTSAATDSVLAPIVNPGRRWRYSPRDMPMGVAVPDAIIVPDNHSGACFAKRPLRFDAGPCRHYSPTLAGSLTIVTSSNTRTKDGQDTGGAVTVLTRPMHLRSGSNSRVCS